MVCVGTRERALFGRYPSQFYLFGREEGPCGGGSRGGVDIEKVGGSMGSPD